MDFLEWNIYEFRLKFHWSLYPRVQLTIFDHWFIQWLGAGQATSHYLNQWWLDYRRIYASLGLNELNTQWRYIISRKCPDPCPSPHKAVYRLPSCRPLVTQRQAMTLLIFRGHHSSVLGDKIRWDGSESLDGALLVLCALPEHPGIGELVSARGVT